jgi:hypothetical protein
LIYIILRFYSVSINNKSGSTDTSFKNTKCEPAVLESPYVMIKNLTTKVEIKNDYSS